MSKMGASRWTQLSNANSTVALTRYPRPSGAGHNSFVAMLTAKRIPRLNGQKVSEPIAVSPDLPGLPEERLQPSRPHQAASGTSTNLRRRHFRWRGLALHLGRRKRPVLTLVADDTYPHLFRIRYPDGWTSTPANISRAKDAAYAVTADGGGLHCACGCRVGSRWPYVCAGLVAQADSLGRMDRSLLQPRDGMEAGRVGRGEGANQCWRWPCSRPKAARTTSIYLSTKLSDPRGQGS